MAFNMDGHRAISGACARAGISDCDELTVALAERLIAAAVGRQL
jgi:hypothetical protein